MSSKLLRISQLHLLLEIAATIFLLLRYGLSIALFFHTKLIFYGLSVLIANLDAAKHLASKRSCSFKEGLLAVTSFIITITKNRFSWLIEGWALYLVRFAPHSLNTVESLF